MKAWMKVVRCEQTSWAVFAPAVAECIMGRRSMCDWGRVASASCATGGLETHPSAEVDGTFQMGVGEVVQPTDVINMRAYRMPMDNRGSPGSLCPVRGWSAGRIN